MPSGFLSLIEVVVFLYLAWQAVLSWTRYRRDSVAVLKEWRPWMLATGVLAVLTVIASTFLLYTLLPPTRYGWMNLLGGSGNLLLGPLAHPSAGLKGGALLLGLWLLVFLACLPLFAWYEEVTFRSTFHRKALLPRLLSSLGFGLAHLAMGIPLCAAVSLGIGGFYFGEVFRRGYRRARSQQEALLTLSAAGGEQPLESTRLEDALVLKASHRSAAAHLTYNLLLLGVLLATLL